MRFFMPLLPRNGKAQPVPLPAEVTFVMQNQVIPAYCHVLKLGLGLGGILNLICLPLVAKPVQGEMPEAILPDLVDADPRELGGNASSAHRQNLESQSASVLRLDSQSLRFARLVDSAEVTGAEVNQGNFPIADLIAIREPRLSKSSAQPGANSTGRDRSADLVYDLVESVELTKPAPWSVAKLSSASANLLENRAIQELSVAQMQPVALDWSEVNNAESWLIQLDEHALERDSPLLTRAAALESRADTQSADIQSTDAQSTDAQSTDVQSTDTQSTATQRAAMEASSVDSAVDAIESAAAEALEIIDSPSTADPIAAGILTDESALLIAADLEPEQLTNLPEDEPLEDELLEDEILESEILEDTEAAEAAESAAQKRGEEEHIAVEIASADLLSELLDDQGVVTQVYPVLDDELGTLRLLQLRSRNNEELGILRLLQTAQAAPKPPPAPIAFLGGRLGFVDVDNVFRTNDRVEEQIYQAGTSLYLFPKLSDSTSFYAIAETNIARYDNITPVNYNEVQLQLGLRQRLRPRTFAQVGWRNQRLYAPGFREKLFGVNYIDALVSHRSILNSKVWLDSFYQMRLGFADPVTASRFRQTLTLSLNYGVTRDFRTSLLYQLDFDDYTQIPRYDTYQQVLGIVSYNLTPESRLSFFGGTRFGNSSLSGVNLDDTFYGAGLNVSVPLF